ncbi:uncharacterized protein LOC134265513 [Saccostrea cucullata]|uniref:uncharacterized protein LOC134265513 n=1 Tax=Saccostrea cuccullata TaxID=36930 RepID=UPI002ED631ED
MDLAPKKKSQDAKLAILSFSYNWADIVEQEEKLKSNGDVLVPQKHLDQTNVTSITVEAAGFSTAELAKSKSEILDFGEEAVTSVDAKLAILAFSYNWADVVEEEEKLKCNGDVSGPMVHLGQTIADVLSKSENSSTVEATNSKEARKAISNPNLSNGAPEYKDTADTNFGPTQRDSRPLQLGEKDNKDAAESSSFASPNKMEKTGYRMDNSVIQCMKRLTHISDAKTGFVVGEIHAQCIPQESDKRNRQPRRTECSITVSKELQSLYPQITLLDGTPVRYSINSGATATCSTNSGTIGTFSTNNRTRKICGLEIIDQEISILSTEPEQLIAPDIQESKNEETDAENEYFTKHPLMRLFLCGACCSKKRKTKTTEKVGLFRRIRKIFHRK